MANEEAAEGESSERVRGVVKWFSNKKGFGFIGPTSDNSITKEDVFVHQTAVKSDGFRSLSEGWDVEFEIVNDKDEKVKAINVTSPGGGVCVGPKKKHVKKADDENSASGKPNLKEKTKKKEQKAVEKSWHDCCTKEVKECLTKKKIRHTTGTVDVSIGQQRLKLGTRGYISMAHADGILSEGTFHCNSDGNIQLTWEHVIQFKNNVWIRREKDDLITEFSLMDDRTKAVGHDETAETLWGVGKPDPRDALIEQGFQMRRVVLTPKVQNVVTK